MSRTRSQLHHGTICTDSPVRHCSFLFRNRQATNQRRTRHGAGHGNRTRVTCLGSRYFAIKLPRRSMPEPSGGSRTVCPVCHYARRLYRSTAGGYARNRTGAQIYCAFHVFCGCPIAIGKSRNDRIHIARFPGRYPGIWMTGILRRFSDVLQSHRILCSLLGGNITLP